jgi:hypothetical protein
MIIVIMVITMIEIISPTWLIPPLLRGSLLSTVYAYNNNTCDMDFELFET